MSGARIILAVAVLGVLPMPLPGMAGPYVAFSLHEASQRAEAGKVDTDLARLAGMTRVVGMVQDGAGDVILVGRRLEGRPALTLEGLVVALRARLLHDEWPTVSIDPVEATSRTGLQRVNFSGGIGQTQVGQEFLAADVFLKRYGLETIPPIAPGKSYRFLVGRASQERLAANGVRVKALRWEPVTDMNDALESIQGSPVEEGPSHQVRFWFYPMRARFVAREGVFCISELRLGVTRELLDANPHEQVERSALASAADAFATGVVRHLPALTALEPALGRLKGLYDLVAVAEGIRNLQRRPDLSHLLGRYRVRVVENDPEFKLLMVRGLLERSDGATEIILISGGVSLETQLEWLNEGDVTPLRDIVVKTRPSPDALYWRLPLEGWDMPNAQDLTRQDLETATKHGDPVWPRPGFTLSTQTAVFAPPGRASTGPQFPGFSPPSGVPAPAIRAPRIDYLDRLGGVVINTVVDEGAFRQDRSGGLDALRDRILKSRTRPDALVFPKP